MNAELFSLVYAFLGNRTSNPDGDVWEHGPLRRLVVDLLADVNACRGYGADARASEPITWPELVRRSEDTEWVWDACIGCGSPDVATRGLILEDGPVGALRRVAWCSHPNCEHDRDLTDYLLAPRRDGAS